MKSFKAITPDFAFLLLEVQGQVETLQHFFEQQTPTLRQQIAHACDKTYNLKMSVEAQCSSRFHTLPTLSTTATTKLRAMGTIAHQLHVISRTCNRIAKQFRFITEHSQLHPEEYLPFFEDITNALNRIQPALEKKNINLASTIARVEKTSDERYRRIVDRLLNELNTGTEAAGHLTVIFIYRYLEQIGDALEEIGSALVCIALGSSFKPAQYNSLKETLSGCGFCGSMSDVEYEAIIGSRSGCRIGLVKAPEGSAPSGKWLSIHKTGSHAKIMQEKENIERWQHYFPALVPTIYNFHEDEHEASLLTEVLEGSTLDKTILTAQQDEVERALATLTRTVEYVWTTTKHPEPLSTDYMQQLSSRLPPVLKVHPTSLREFSVKNETYQLATEELIRQCSTLEQGLRAPFSVLIHGDFNMNNIVYNDALHSIRFIDLYRSKQFDYIQDASVFLVSIFRLPIFEPQLRDRMNYATETFYRFVRSFAEDHGDTTFDSRLSLALARSFYTSIRFELNQSFAKRMYLRSHTLMDKLLSHPSSDWESFILPDDILYY